MNAPEAFSPHPLRCCQCSDDAGDASASCSNESKHKLGAREVQERCMRQVPEVRVYAFMCI
jgi:hypothetical protein